MPMATNQLVAVRVRPLIKRELKSSCTVHWSTSDKEISRVTNDANNFSAFAFDHVFNPEHTNRNVYNVLLKDIVHDAVHGINGTVFAYGQTSSGKTYTMMGSESEPGLIKYAVEEVFTLIEQSKDRDFLTSMSYMEIYNEEVKDLLTGQSNLKIRESEDGSVYVEHKGQELVEQPSDVFHLMSNGDQLRHIGSTNMNEQSSRSHAIASLYIESKHKDDKENGAVLVSQLNFVDLAGSEKAHQTGAVGRRLKEGAHINTSLLALSNCISKLADKSLHIPYRDSKLTRILQSSLGGNSRTAMVCNVTPASIDETISTLRFASRAKKVSTKPIVNEVINPRTMMRRLEKRVNELEQQLAEKSHLDSKQRSKLFKELFEQLPVPEEKINRRMTWCPGPGHQPGQSLITNLNLIDETSLNESAVGVTSSSFNKPYPPGRLPKKRHRVSLNPLSDRKPISLDDEALVELPEKRQSLEIGVSLTFPEMSLLKQQVKELQKENDTLKARLAESPLEVSQGKSGNSCPEEPKFSGTSVISEEGKVDNVTELQSVIRSLRDELREKDVELDSMRSELSSHNNCEGVKAELEQLKVKSIQLSKHDDCEAVEKLRADLKSKQDELDNLAKELELAQEEWSSVSCELDILKIELSNHTDCEVIKCEVEKLREDLKSEQEKSNKMEKEIKLAQETLQNTLSSHTDNEAFKIEAEKLRSDLKTKQDELDNLAKGLELAQEEWSSVSCELDILKIELSNHTDCEVIKCEVEKLREDLKSEQEKSNKMEKEIKLAQETLQNTLSSHTDNEAFKIEAENLRSDHKSKQDELDNLVKELELAQEESSSVNCELDILKIELSNHTDCEVIKCEVEKLREDLKSEQEKSNKMEKEIKLAQETLQNTLSSHTDNEAFKIEAENLSSDLKSKQDELDNLVKELELAQEESSSVNCELDILKIELSNHTDCEVIKCEVEKLREDLKSEQEKSNKMEKEIKLAQETLQNTLSSHTDNEAFKIEAENLSSDLKSKQDELDNLVKELELAQEESSSVNCELDILKIELSNHTDCEVIKCEVEKLREDLKSEQEKSNKMEDGIKLAQETGEAFKVEVEKLREDLKSKHESQSQLENELKMAQEAMQLTLSNQTDAYEIRSEVEKLRDSLRSEQEKSRELENELKMAQEAMRLTLSNQTDADEIRSEVEKLRDSLRSEQEKSRELENELKMAQEAMRLTLSNQTDADEIRSEVEELRDSLRSEQEKSRELENELKMAQDATQITLLNHTDCEAVKLEAEKLKDDLKSKPAAQSQLSQTDEAGLDVKNKLTTKDLLVERLTKKLEMQIYEYNLLDESYGKLRQEYKELEQFNSDEKAIYACRTPGQIKEKELRSKIRELQIKYDELVHEHEQSKSNKKQRRSTLQNSSSLSPVREFPSPGAMNISINSEVMPEMMLSMMESPNLVTDGTMEVEPCEESLGYAVKNASLQDNQMKMVDASTMTDIGAYLVDIDETILGLRKTGAALEKVLADEDSIIMQTPAKQDLNITFVSGMSAELTDFRDGLEKAYAVIEDLQTRHNQLKNLREECDKKRCGTCDLSVLDCDHIYFVPSSEWREAQEELEAQIEDKQQEIQTLQARFKEVEVQHSEKLDTVKAEYEFIIEATKQQKIRHLIEDNVANRTELSANTNVQELSETHSKAIEDMEAKHKNEIDDIVGKHQNDIRDMKAGHEKDIHGIETKHQLDMEDVKTMLQNKIDHLVAENNRNVTQMKEQFELEMAAIKKPHEQERESREKTCSMEKKMEERLQQEEKQLQDKYSHLFGESKLDPDQEILKMKSDYEKTVSDLKTSYDDRISSIETRHEETLVSMKAVHEQEVNGIKAEFHQQVSEINMGHEQAVAELKQSYEKRLEEMHCLHTEKIEQAEARHVETLEKLKEELASAQTDDKQEEIASLKTQIVRLEDLRSKDVLQQESHKKLIEEVAAQKKQEFDAALTNLNERLAEAGAVEKELRGRLNQIQSENQRVKEELVQNMEQLKIELEQARLKYADMESQLTRKDQEHEEIMCSALDDRRNLVDKFRANRDELESLKKEKESLTAQLKTDEEAVRAQVTKELKGNMASLKRMAEKLAKENKDLLETNSMLRRRLDNPEGEIKSAVVLKDRYRDDAQKYLAELTDIDEKIQLFGEEYFGADDWYVDNIFEKIRPYLPEELKIAVAKEKENEPEYMNKLIPPPPPGPATNYGTLCENMRKKMHMKIVSLESDKAGLEAEVLKLKKETKVIDKLHAEIQSLKQQLHSQKERYDKLDDLFQRTEKELEFVRSQKASDSVSGNSLSTELNSHGEPTNLMVLMKIKSLEHERFCLRRENHELQTTLDKLRDKYMILKDKHIRLTGAEQSVRESIPARIQPEDQAATSPLPDVTNSPRVKREVTTGTDSQVKPARSIGKELDELQSQAPSNTAFFEDTGGKDCKTQ